MQMVRMTGQRRSRAEQTCVWSEEKSQQNRADWIDTHTHTETLSHAMDSIMLLSSSEGCALVGHANVNTNIRRRILELMAMNAEYFFFVDDN